MNTETTQAVAAATTQAVVEAPKPIADVAIDGASNTGIYIGCGVALLVVIAVVGVWLKLKK